MAKDDKDNSKKNTKELIINSIVVGVVALIAGYILGALIGFGENKIAGVYISDKNTTITLYEDGTCKRFDTNKECTYQVSGNDILFNDDLTVHTTLVENGLVFKDTYFIKLEFRDKK